jgi:hypothetical protein
MERGYCPHCERVVKATRRSLDVALIILLAIFTAGIGVLIYLVVFYSRNDKNLCDECNSTLQTVPKNYDVDSQENLAPKPNPYKISSRNDSSDNEEEITSKKGEYCPFCGISVDPNMNKCPNCSCKL